jgi:AraC family transcriptional regulator
MSGTLTNAELCTGKARVRVYTYRYDTPSRQSRSPNQDVLALFRDQARTACAFFRTGDVTSRMFPLGGMMIVPAGVEIDATGPGGDRRLASCTMAAGILPADFDRRDQADLAACGDIRDPNVRTAMQRMAAEAIQPGFGADILIDALSMSVKVDLARYFARRRPEQPVHVGVLAPWQLRRLEEYVQATHAGGMRIADLAQVVEISASHLARTFKKTTGRTVHQFVEEARIARAGALLTDTSLPLKQIAAQLGFGTPSSFSQAFRRAVGVAPGQFRQERRTVG